MVKKVRVLIVDDSIPMRMLLTEILSADSGIEVVGAARDPLEARELIKALNPDVLTLDVEMPKMDGLTFLEKLMRLRPMPVVMVSSLTQRNCEVTMEALSLGAVDFVPKPTVDTLHGVGLAAGEIRAKVKAAATARIQSRGSQPVPATPRHWGPVKTNYAGIAIGASTGGTEAVLKVLSGLPADLPPIFVVQHIPPGFSTSFASRVNQGCEMTVKIAEHGEIAKRGVAYIAPGGFHLELVGAGSDVKLKVSDRDRVNLHCPSVDVLLHSVANVLGKRAIGIMLTGMGSDGAAGMREMHDRGARNLAQDESTCVVFGMPARAIESGGVDEVMPLPNIASRLVQILQSPSLVS